MIPRDRADHVLCCVLLSGLTLFSSTSFAVAPAIGVAAGTYNGEAHRLLPLLVTTNNAGASWDYPRAILDDLQITIDPSFSLGLFRGAACTGAIDHAVCIAVGSFCKDESCNIQVPLVALGKNNVNTWEFPHSVFEDLQIKIHPDITRAFLDGASCTGSGHNAFCVASGIFLTPSLQSPLIALSCNGGETWTYPKSIFKNLTTAIDPAFTGGFLTSTGCNKSTTSSVCMAGGAFSAGAPINKQLPLVAVSKDKGKNWLYPSTVFHNLTTRIDPNFVSGEFSSSSCTGTGSKTVCIGAGRYFNNASTQPLLALSMNGGDAWTYPPEIFTDLPARIGHDFTGAFFRGSSCTGKDIRARCIATGAFTNTKGAETPLLALTKDGGQTWTYPPYIYTKLKTQVDPLFRAGSLDAATCMGENKESICMAAGKYCRDRFCSVSFPLIAVTRDGGKTWSYPPSVFQNLTTVIDPNYGSGFFNAIKCTGPEVTSFCIASGQYSNHNTHLPLVAYSTDNGMTWTYPPYVFQNLTTTINPDFMSGTLGNTGATGGKLKMS